MSIVDVIRQHVGPNEIQQIAAQIGVDPSTATRAVDAAIPSIATAVEQTGAAGGAGAEAGSLGSASGLLGGLGSLMNAGGGGGGGGGGGDLLSGLLGQHADGIANSIQQASGLDASKVKPLLAALAPMIMTAVAHYKSGGGAGQTGSSIAGDILGGFLKR